MLPKLTQAIEVERWLRDMHPSNQKHLLKKQWVIKKKTFSEHDVLDSILNKHYAQITPKQFPGTKKPIIPTG